jgi:hypothetical protein
MAKLFWFAVIALAGIYGVGYASLNAGAVTIFLNDMEVMTTKGDAQGLCDLFADAAQVAILDHTSGKDQTVKGGKDVACQQIAATAPAMAMLQTTTEVQREELKVERSLLKPWTAEISYTEKRHTNMQRAGLQISTESDDKLTLIRTFSGVKITRLESEAWLAD